MATLKVMDSSEQIPIRASRWAAAVLKHNGGLMGESRPVYLDTLLSWAIDAGLLIDPTEEIALSPVTLEASDHE